MRALHITLRMLEKKVRNLFNGIKPPGYVGNTRNSESSAGRKRELLARATASSAMDVIRKILFEATSTCLIKTLCFTEWLMKLSHRDMCLPKLI